MKKTLATLLVLLSLLSFSLVSCGQKELTADKADFIINNGAEPQSLDPSHIQGVPEHRIYMALFEGLVVNDPKTCRAVPGIAESWTTSADGLTLTFKLRKATWSDGVAITAKDFVDGWLRTLDPATASEYAYMVGMLVKGADEFNAGKGPKEAVAVKAIDDRTLEVGLKGPAAYAVDMMAHYAFSPLPMHAIAKFGDEWIKAENWVGNGPYVVKEWKAQQHLFVVKNAKYWDAKSVKLPSIKFLPIEDNKTAYNMYKNGEIDWQTGIALDLLDEIKLRKDYMVAPQIATYYYIFNNSKKPTNDVRVRKALAMAVDTKSLVEKVTKGGQIATSSIVPPMEGYTPAKGNPFNVEEAKKMLAEAGYPNGKGFPKIAILYNTNDAHKKIAEFVQEQWKNNLGIEVTLVNQEWKTFLDTRSNSHDFVVSRAGWTGDYLDPNTFLDMFIVGSGNNDGLYNNPKYDELVKKAMTMPAGPERLQVLAQAEQILLDQEQAVAPFYSYVEQHLIDTTKWGGWYNNPLGIHNWKFIYKK
ncbi:MAG: peptide ABC transporter substrate-binding protein [Spirochaetaceae bacterium]|nr:peptide ABC transporter substrate-binding protein [Spirochaetaceae bacterium]